MKYLFILLAIITFVVIVNYLMSKRQINIGPLKGNNFLVGILLSVLLPGLGHFYIGQPDKGKSFIIAYVIAGVLNIFLSGTNLGYITIAVFLAIMFYNIFDVYVCFVEDEKERELLPREKKNINIVVMVIVMVVWGLVSSVVGNVRGYNSEDDDIRAALDKKFPGFKESQTAFYDTLQIQPGDSLVLNKVIYKFRKPKRGEIIAYTFLPKLPIWAMILNPMFLTLRVPQVGIVVGFPGETIKYHVVEDNYNKYRKIYIDEISPYTGDKGGVIFGSNYSGICIPQNEISPMQTACAVIDYLEPYPAKPVWQGAVMGKVIAVSYPFYNMRFVYSEDLGDVDTEAQ